MNRKEFAGARRAWLRFFKTPRATLQAPEMCVTPVTAGPTARGNNRITEQPNNRTRLTLPRLIR